MITTTAILRRDTYPTRSERRDWQPARSAACHSPTHSCSSRMPILSVCMKGPAECGPSLRRDGAYARTAPLVLWMMTSPPVTFGGVWMILSSFSSRTHSDATRVDSLACVEVSKRPIELMTPSPVSMRK
jgi:hypothetical protein